MNNITEVVVFLLTITINDGYRTGHQYYKMPDWETCFKAVEKARINFSPIINSDSDNNSIAIMCVGEKS